MADYLFYWKQETANDVPEGEALLYGASEQFERLTPGDVVWVVSSRGRAALTLVGRLGVVRVTDVRSEAQAWVGRQALWQATWYALADREQARSKQDIDISRIAGDLRFDGGPNRLPANFSGQQLQSMRTLLPETAVLLNQVWETATQGGRAALSLSLHGRYGRAAVYSLFGVEFSQRNRRLIQGLSPQLSDGGYCIFITLDKSDFDEAYDYEDQLYVDSFEWVTRRGVDQSHADYVNLRQPSTRVSLFVRNHDRENFVYLGELLYLAHNEFRSERDGRKQQKYLFRLIHPVPSSLLAELATGADASPVKAGARSGRSSTGRSTSHRRPATLEGARQALSYVLGDLNRIVVPAHHNYQVRLKEFLTSRGLESEWERDFVDVRFCVGGYTFIGEVKVTTYLSLDEAFRTALGQLLFYGHIGFDKPPEMIMLLDQEPDPRRIQLASRLGVIVVAERTEGQFVVLNPEVSPALAPVFVAASAAVP